MRPLAFPRPLAPGSEVAVVAPSSPFEPVLGWRGLGVLGERFRVRYSRGIFSRHGYLAGDAARREAELAEVLADPTIAAVFAARGGYGANQFAHRLNWAEFAARPKWLVGFSDVTALHVEAGRAGVASVHGCHVTALGEADGARRAELFDLLAAPSAPRELTGLTVVRPGQAAGVLRGGNLTMLHACAAAGRLSLPDPTVLLLEDVNERPYRLDRALTTLEVGGHLRGVRAVVVGEFTRCEPGPDGLTAEAVVAGLLAPLGVPVVTGAPIGHGRQNRPVVLGSWAEVDALAQGSVRLLGPH